MFCGVHKGFGSSPLEKVPFKEWFPEYLSGYWYWILFIGVLERIIFGVVD